MKTELKLKITRKITDIPLEDWNKAFPPGIEDYHFFKTLDESDFSQFSFYYILIYQADVPVGATSCFLMDYPLDLAVSGRFKKITNLIRKISPRLLDPKILLCGLPMSQGKIGITFGEPQEVMQAIYNGMEEIAKKERAAIIAFKDFTVDYKNYFDEFLNDGFSKIQSLPSTNMDIAFASFDQYMNSLSSASRSGLKRKLKKIDGKVKIDLEITHKLENGSLERVHELYLETCRRQELNFEILPSNFFANITKNMPQAAKFFLWRMDGKIVAFALSLVSENTFIDYYLGFDYTLAYDYSLYFVRFRDMMNWCIANNMKKYEMGPTSYEPKRRLGFNFVPLYIYAKHRNKFFNSFFKIICKVLQPENFHPVFKELAKLREAGIDKTKYGGIMS